MTLVAVVLSVLQPVGAEPVAIIVHPDTEIESVSRAELSKVFLKRLRTWTDGTRAMPVDQAPDSVVRQDFTRWIHDRRVVNVEVYWKRLIFSGRDVPPSEVTGDDAVIEFVRTTPGAVGYVALSARLDGVRKLRVTD